jgi:hypothetical protein
VRSSVLDASSSRHVSLPPNKRITSHPRFTATDALFPTGYEISEMIYSSTAFPRVHRKSSISESFFQTTLGYAAAEDGDAVGNYARVHHHLGKDAGSGIEPERHSTWC